MRRHHARVAWVKLAVEALGFELVVKGVDAVGHDERRAFLTLGEEVTHRPVERPRHADGFAFAREQGEGAVNVADGCRFPGKHTLARILNAHVVDAIERRIEEINDAFNSVVHKNKSESGCLSMANSIRRARLMSRRVRSKLVVRSAAGASDTPALHAEIRPPL